MRIILAFSDLKILTYPDDVILYNNGVTPLDERYVDINSFAIDKRELSDYYDSKLEFSGRNFTRTICEAATSSMNNLYTNHLVLFKWKAAIDYYTEKGGVDELIITDLNSCSSYAPYYEAEGEAHRRLLYKTYDFIPSILNNYIKDQYSEIILTILKKRSSTTLCVRIFLRRYVLLLIKSIFFLVQLARFKIRTKGTIEGIELDKIYENIHLTRSVAHFDAIQILLKSQSKTVVFCGEGAFTFLKNFRFTEKNYKNSVSFLSYLKFSDVLVAVASTFRAIRKIAPKQTINFEGIVYSYSDTLIEIIIAYYDVMITEVAYIRFLKSLKVSTNAKLYTSEMYSPFAYITAKVGKELQKTTFQLQTTNMFVTFEPNFIHCDFFIFNTRTLSNSYAAKYPERKKKVPFLGNFMVNKPNEIIDSNEFRLQKVMYFTQPLTDEDLEQEIIEKLVSLSEVFKFRLFVKLHPRDRIKKLEKFIDKVTVIDQSASFHQYMLEVDLCVLKTSSIASKIILQGTPILFCLLSEWARRGELDYIDLSYFGSITQLTEIESKIRNYKSLSIAFINYRKNYIINNGLDSGIEDFLNEIEQIR